MDNNIADCIRFSIILTIYLPHGTALTLSATSSPALTESTGASHTALILRTPKAFDYDFDNFMDKLQNPRPSSSRPEVVLPKTLSTLEKVLDHLLQLGEEEATGCRGAVVSDGHTGTVTQAMPTMGNH